MQKYNGGGGGGGTLVPESAGGSGRWGGGQEAVVPTINYRPMQGTVGQTVPQTAHSTPVCCP